MLLTIIFITIVTLILIVTAFLQQLRLVTWILIAGYLALIIFMFRENANSNLDNKNLSHNSQQGIDIDLETEVDSIFIQNNEIISTEESILEVDNSPTGTTGSLKINSITMTREIIDRTPGEASVQFNRIVGSIICFTSVFNLDESTTISHVWKYKGQLISEIEIPVGVSVRWRCWSQLSIKPEWIGDWEVIAMDEEGQRLDSVKFQIVLETFREF